MCVGFIKKSFVKLFLKPKDLGEVSDEILYGMTFEALREVDNNWIYIKTEYGYEGFMKKSDGILDCDTTKEWINNRDSIVINNFADVLQEDKIESRILVTLPRGAYLSKTGKISSDKKWSEVKLLQDSTGWIKSKFIRDIPNLNISEETFRENLVKDSLLYLGTQYRWGGKTPEGIDCSGLCSIVYMLNGVKIYRDSKVKEGFPIKKIDFKYIKKGDLIYFPGHVAMYLGNKKYIHSSNGNNTVKINSLDQGDNDYLEHLAKSILYIGSMF